LAGHWRRRAREGALETRKDRPAVPKKWPVENGPLTQVPKKWPVENGLVRGGRKRFAPLSGPALRPRSPMCFLGQLPKADPLETVPLETGPDRSCRSSPKRPKPRRPFSISSISIFGRTLRTKKTFWDFIKSLNICLGAIVTSLVLAFWSFGLLVLDFWESRGNCWNDGPERGSSGDGAVSETGPSTTVARDGPRSDPPKRSRSVAFQRLWKSPARDAPAVATRLPKVGKPKDQKANRPNPRCQTMSKSHQGGYLKIE